MKYHITPKQAREVTEEQFYSFFNEIVPRSNWASYHCRKMDIGKMIDYLDEVTVGRSIVDRKWNVCTFLTDRHYEGKELVDALWEAMKEDISE
ncbi:hypothetical protein IFU39_00395 [Paenibacillus sp. CFBP 13594]|uniref:hypothetical protein n=1 Tax=Paenibacillus sp. CFBP 13594 TaxID=2774037 RepID=UPI00177F31AC|nr:hypothetical protein [Paenibacillus sp. CFBP 13594]MBD8836278.1 hypothetical protein [Paenibacillus sp. CFBP 13594]